MLTATALLQYLAYLGGGRTLVPAVAVSLGETSNGTGETEGTEGD